VSAVIGFVVGFFAIFIARNIEVDQKIPFLAALPIVLSLLSMIGIVVASWIGRKFPVLFEAAKFALVGVLNTMVDLGVLNILIFMTGIAGGISFSFFKAISFLVSVTNSYVWNKFWTFRSAKEPRPIEFAAFVAIAGVGFVINVGVASLIVNVIGAPAGISQKIWANVGAILATLIAMTWNFLGYKLIVFKSKKSSITV
jgi:putative flippase GtrA